MKFYRVVLYKYSSNGAELQHFAFNATKGRFAIKIAYCVLKHTQEIHKVSIFVLKDNQPTDRQLSFGISDIKDGKLGMLQALQKFEYGKEE